MSELLHNQVSKVMLKILLNGLKVQMENIIAEDQAVFRPGRTSTE